MLKFFKKFPILFLFMFSSLIAKDSFDNKIIEDVKITIENAKDYNTTALVSKLTSQKGNFFSQETFDNDLKKLSEEFDRIEPSVDIKDEKVFIDIKLWLRPTIVKINWKGNQKFSSKKLQKELDIKLPLKYNKIDFNNSLAKVKEFYIKKGHFESQISYKEIPLDKNEMIIDIDVKEGKSGEILEIKFNNFSKEEQSDLLREMVSKKYNKFLSWISGTGIFRDEAIEHDKMNIINYLQNRGFADAKVDIKILEDPAFKKIIIEVSTDRGILYNFGKVTFDGNCLLTNDIISGVFQVHPGDVFSPEKIRQTTQLIKDLYGEKGYIDANVYYDITLMENEPTYNVNFYIEEGECYKIGLIKIFGNKSTKSRVILKESLLVPGQTFDTRKLRATQTKLENLGYFKTVNVFAVQSCDPNLAQLNYRDVHIEVEEASTGHLSFSAGFSGSEKVTGTLDLTENNFDISGFTKLFKYGPSAFRGNGEYAQSKVSLGKKQRNFSLNWMDPYFRDSKWRIGFEFSGTHSRLQSKDYKVDTLGGSVYTSYPLTNFWSAGMKYRLRGTRNKVKRRDLTQDEQDAKEAQAENDGIISGIGSNISYDSTNNSYKPHQGLRSLLECEYVGIGGKYNFFKFSYLNSYYYPLWLKGTMKYRCEMRFIQTIEKLDAEKVPLSERFFLGGETTVRGYKPFSIGPKMPGKPDDPFGGVSSLLLSIEYNHEVHKNLFDIFLFADAGSVKYETFSLGKLRGSVGIGTRLEIMSRMPITVGWGYPIGHARKDDQQRVFFQMGGQF